MKRNLFILGLILFSSTSSFAQQSVNLFEGLIMSSNISGKKVDKDNFLNTRLSEYKKNKINSLLNLQDRYELYNNDGLKIIAHKIKDESDFNINMIDNKITNLNVGDIYDAKTIISNPKLKSSWTQIKGVKHLGTVSFNDIYINDKNFKREVHNVQPDGNTLNNNLTNYINGNNVEFTHRTSSKFNFTNNSEDNILAIESKVKVPTFSAGFSSTTSKENIYNSYKYEISNLLYEIDYDMEQLSFDNNQEESDVLMKLDPKKSPVYVSKIKYGYKAELLITSNYTKRELDMMLSGSYKAVSGSVSSKDKSIKIEVSIDTKTYGIEPFSFSAVSSSPEDLTKVIQSFNEKIIEKINNQLKNGKKIGAPLEAEFKYVADDSIFDVGRIINDNILSYEYEIEGIKLYRPYLKYVKGENVKTGTFSNDHVLLRPLVNYKFDYNLLYKELNTISNIKIDYQDFYYNVNFKKFGKNLISLLENEFRDYEFAYNNFLLVSNIEVDDYKKGTYNNKKSLLDVKNSEWLMSYQSFGKFSKIEIKPEVRCMNAIQSCENHGTFNSVETKGVSDFQIGNGEATFFIQWVEVEK